MIVIKEPMKGCMHIWAGILWMTLAVSIAGGCAPKTDEGWPESDVGVVAFQDDMGREISLSAVPQTMVVMNPGAAEVLYAIGAQDRILALGEYCNYPEETADVKKVGTGQNTNLEELIALDPDCVISSTMTQDEAVFQTLEQAGIPVIIIDATDIEGTYDNIGKLGLLAGREEAADNLIAQMQVEFAELAKLTENLDRQKAYVEISPLAYGLWSCGTGTFQDELLAAAGLDNVFHDIQGWQQVSEEQVLARNPDVIFTTMEYFENTDPIEEILSREGWQNTAAIKAGRVVLVDGDMVGRPGPRLAQAARALYEAAYGQNP